MKGITFLDYIKGLSGDLKDSYIKVFKDGLSEIDYGIPNQNEPDYEFFAYSDLKEVSSFIIKDTNIVTVWFYDDDGFENGYETVIELYI